MKRSKTRKASIVALAAMLLTAMVPMAALAEDDSADPVVDDAVTTNAAVDVDVDVDKSDKSDKSDEQGKSDDKSDEQGKSDDKSDEKDKSEKKDQEKDDTQDPVGKDITCPTSDGWQKQDMESGTYTGDFGYLAWGGATNTDADSDLTSSDNTVAYSLNDGYTIDLCVKGGRDGGTGTPSADEFLNYVSGAQGSGSLSTLHGDVSHISFRFTGTTPAAVNLELLKVWLDADGALIAAPDDVFWSAGLRYGADSHTVLNIGSDTGIRANIDVEDGRTRYVVMERASDEFAEITCTEAVTDRVNAGIAGDRDVNFGGTGTFAVPTEDTLHVLCNQLAEVDDTIVRRPATPEYFLEFDKQWVGLDASDLLAMTTESDLNAGVSFTLDDAAVALGQRVEVDLDTTYDTTEVVASDALPTGCSYTSDIDDTYTTPATAADGDVFTVVVVNTILCVEGVAEEEVEREPVVDRETDTTVVDRTVDRTEVRGVRTEVREVPTQVLGVTATRAALAQTGVPALLLALMGLLGMGLGGGLLHRNKRK